MDTDNQPMDDGPHSPRVQPSQPLWIYPLCVIYVIVVAIAAEIYGYIWHRFGAHSGYVPGIKDTHRIHHMLGNSKSQDGAEADEDFVWILLQIIILEVILGLGVRVGLVPMIAAILTVVTLVAIFAYNWWLHRAFHQPDHWLLAYPWFVREKERHFMHHSHPNRNFGIATHFNDTVFGTWVEPDD